MLSILGQDLWFVSILSTRVTTFPQPVEVPFLLEVGVYDSKLVP